MGEKIKKAFEIAKEKSGAKGSLRLTMKTGISVFEAAKTPDHGDNLLKLEQALLEITGKRVSL